MDIVVMLALVGLGLAACALLMFGNSLRRHDYEHADRLALLPIDDDDAPPVARSRTAATGGASVKTSVEANRTEPSREKSEASSAPSAPRSN